MMNQAIHKGRRDHGVSQVVAKLFEADVRGQDRGSFAVAPLDNLEEKGCVSARLLFQAVESDLVDAKDFRSGIGFELPVERVVGKRAHKIAEHGGCGGIPAPV